MERLNILILNGSPKGKMSVTMQYINYLELRFPQHSFEYVNAAQSCRKFENNEAAFNTLMDRVKASDLILWAYPLYYMLVCSQYKRFIELIFERNREEAFRGKYTAALSTSIHFYDNTARNYIHSICDDLGTNFLTGITAKMDDLQKPLFRNSLDHLFLEWVDEIHSEVSASRIYAPVNPIEFTYQPSSGSEITASKAAPAAANIPENIKVCIVGDLEDEHSNIRKMAMHAAALFPGTEVIDLKALSFGPCTGCLKCGFDNHCAYEEKDDFIRLHNEKVLTADVIIFAGAIHDRYLSSIWQRYLERSFNRTHQTSLEGKQAGFLISGPLSQNHNTHEILTAYIEVIGESAAGFVTDECADSDLISSQIETLVHRAVSRAADSVSAPKSFLGVGGRKVFRDDIYSHLRFVFQADHKYYKKHGLYDFPQRKISQRLKSTAAVMLTRIPPTRKAVREQLKKGMINPYKKIFSKIEPRQD